MKTAHFLGILKLSQSRFFCTAAKLYSRFRFLLVFLFSNGNRLCWYFGYLIGSILPVNYGCWGFKLTLFTTSLLKLDCWVSCLPGECQSLGKACSCWEAAFPPLRFLLPASVGDEGVWDGRGTWSCWASSTWGSLCNFIVLFIMAFRGRKSGLWDVICCGLGLVYLFSKWNLLLLY